MYGGSVNGEFVFKLSGKTPSFATKAEVHGIEMAHLLAAFGNAHAIMTGRMAGDLTLVGDIEHSSHPLEGMGVLECGKKMSHFTSEEHTSQLQSPNHPLFPLLL